MSAFEISLLASALLCGLTAGLVLTFAIVVMPGIAELDDREYLRAFQVMDGIIQRGHPVFGLVWGGSAIAVLVSLFLGFGALEGTDRILLMVAGSAYIFGVQLPTITINIPLNNRIKILDLTVDNPGAWRVERERFENRWSRWNLIRTVVAVGVTAAYLLLLLGA